MRHLNGWQRLWVIACVGVGVVCGVGLKREFPTEAERHELWIGAANVAYPEVEAYGDKIIPCVVEDVRGNKAAADACAAQIPKPSASATAAHKAVVDKGDEDTRQTIRASQVEAILTWIGAWLGVCTALYAAGWVVAWVVRGFKQQRGTQR